MKITKLLILTSLISIRTIYSQENIKNNPDIPVIEGAYLGQNLPGLTPETFAPGIVSTEHRDLSAFFSPNMKEFYFTRKEAKSGKWSLVVFKSENNRWRGSVVGPRVGRPILAPDGKTMHLGKHYMERTETGWSEVKNLGTPFEEIRIMRLTASAKGTYVFDEATKGGNGILRYSRLINGERDDPKSFGAAINTGKWNAHPFISPDESYIIWDGERDSGYGDSDLYISFWQQDHSWSPAINMGDKINTSSWESGGYVTPDGKYFFFNRGDRDGDIFWVDAQIIENLRPKE